jgi:hypothetical protein
VPQESLNKQNQVKSIEYAMLMSQVDPWRVHFFDESLWVGTARLCYQISKKLLKICQKVAPKFRKVAQSEKSCSNVLIFTIQMLTREIF